MNQKPEQEPLWKEDAYKAFDDSICASVPSKRNAYEYMARLLWPTKTERTRYSRIKACLDPSQESTNFTLEEVVFILNYEDASGVEIAISFLNESVNRKLGDKNAPRSPRSILFDRQAEYMAEVARLQRDIDRIDADPELKAI